MSTVNTIESLISNPEDYIVSCGDLSVGRAENVGDDGEFYVDVLLGSGETQELRFRTAFLAAEFFERQRKRLEEAK